MKIDVSVNIAGIEFRSPVFAASGTFGYGTEIADMAALKEIGAIITKTITLEPRCGNRPPRIAETSCGMLNAIGLQNVGAEKFIELYAPRFKKIQSPVIVSVAGQSVEDYVRVIRKLNKLPGIAAFELNLSCPNLKKRIICFDEKLVKEIVRETSKASSMPVVAKLSGQVSDISRLSKICEDAGADALSVANTFTGMAINIETHRPKLANVTGGLSGPCIKPLALRCVWEVCRSVAIPVIGGGGIMTGSDAIEFFLAGASAVSVGTANFIDPQSAVRVNKEIIDYLKRKNLNSLNEIKGKMLI